MKHVPQNSLIRLVGVFLLVLALAAFADGCGSSGGDADNIVSLPPTGSGSNTGNVGTGTDSGTGSGTSSGTGTGTDTGSGTGTGTDPLPATDQWEQVASGTTRDLYGISFGSATTGWAVGLYETMLCTNNGGDSWVDQFGNIETNIRPTKETSGHFLGSRYTSNSEAHLLDVHAVDANTAWISSYGPCRGLDMTPCFVTTDSGSKWTCVLTATNFQSWGIYAFDGQTARICTQGSDSHTDGDVIIINGGYDVDMCPIGWAALHDISFGTGSDGWAVGVEIWHSTDGGTGWSSQKRPSGTGMLLCVEAVDANNAWACGESGVIIHTTDGGATWSKQESGVGVMLWGIDFIDANQGWCVGADGTILATTDGGATWAAQDSGVSHDLTSVSAIDASHVWACGASGIILRSK